MRRIALFAHYDRDGIIDDHVIYYLRGLKKVVPNILLASDCDLKTGEADKLNGLAELVHSCRHGEYDFGSWKRCFAHLKYDFSTWDEIIIVNDSCFAPIFPFEPVFEKMDTVDCNFWGPSATHIDGEFLHLCSYFIVFRKPVLLEKAFAQFWKDIVALNNKDDIVEIYELGLSRLLHRLGYRWGSYIPIATPCLDWETRYIRDVIPNRYPWVKVRLFRENPRNAGQLGKFLRKLDPYFPRRFVDDYMLRTLGTKHPAHYDLRERKLIDSYKAKWHFLSVTSKIKKNSHKRRLSWWKLYVYAFRFPIFAFALPIMRRS